MRAANHDVDSLDPDPDLLPAYMVERQRVRRLERLIAETAGLLRAALASPDDTHCRTVAGQALAALGQFPEAAP